MSKTTRSPLKENDPNTVGNHMHNPKKRSLDLLELEQTNRQKQRTLRTIEGAIAHAPNALLKNVQGGNAVAAFNRTVSVSKSSVSQAASGPTHSGIAIGVNNEQETAVASKTQSQRLSNKELIDWQNNWRKIMRRDTHIYFDCSEVANDNKKDVLRRAFSSLGAKVKQFFDHEVTIVITSRKINNCLQLPDTDILHRAQKRGYMKIWTLEKASRFLTNMNVDLKQVESDSINGKSIPTSNLLNLLESEKLFGSNERDPKAKRDDLHYFKHPHVYLYDLAQINAPLITFEWKAHEANSGKRKHIYPTVKPGSFGRCPFQGDDATDELQPRRIIKRYKRDKANESYAMKLRRLYQSSAEPSSVLTPSDDIGDDDSMPSTSPDPIILPYQNIYNNSAMQYNKLVSSMSRFKQPRLPRVDTFDEDEIPYGTGVGGAEGPGNYKNKFQQEIRASGVQSVDANSNGNATLGNGLEPVKASNVNKDLLSLKKMVVDRKPLVNAIVPPNSIDTKSPIHDITNTHSSVTANNVSAGKVSAACTQQRLHQPMIKQTPGYCENCKVKYDCLETHIQTEKHRAFASKDENFRGVDAMIQCVQQFRDLNGQ